MKRGYLLLFLLGNLSCVSNPHSMVAEGEIPRLHVDGTEVKETIPFDSLFKKDKIISLETTAESLIKKVGKVSLYKNSIYLLDRSQNKLLQFDMEGHFIRSINHFGQGPGEYSSLVDFQIKDDRIYLLDKYGEQLLAYDMNDSLLFTERVKKSAGIEVLKEGYALNFELGAADNGMDKQYYSYSCYANGNYSHTGIPFNKNLLGLSFSLSEGSNTFYHFNDSVFTFVPFNDTIYSVTPEGMAVPCQVISIGDERIALDDDAGRIKQLRDKSISTSIFAYYKLQDYTLFSYYYGKQNRKYVLADSKHGIIFNTSLTLDADKMPIRLIAFDSDSDSNAVMSLVYPAEVIGLSQRHKESKVLSDLAESLDEDGNPLLVFYSFLLHPNTAD